MAKRRAPGRPKLGGAPRGQERSDWGASAERRAAPSSVPPLGGRSGSDWGALSHQNGPRNRYSVPPVPRVAPAARNSGPKRVSTEKNPLAACFKSPKRTASPAAKPAPSSNDMPARAAAREGERVERVDLQLRVVDGVAEACVLRARHRGHQHAALAYAPRDAELHIAPVRQLPPERERRRAEVEAQAQRALAQAEDV